MRRVPLGSKGDRKMAQVLTVNLNRPIISAKFLDGNADGDAGQLRGCERVDSESDTVQTLRQELEAQKTAFLEACRTLNDVISKLNQFYGQIFAGHREEIARLSVEIARKILMQKVENGDYEIESIVKEALSKAPADQDVIVHLNPEDLEKCRKAQQDEPGGLLSGIKLISDPDIGRAECMLESPKGVIKSMIADSLERIGKALEKAN
jgi:flagellar biosynthesis/type III secretory pathway protein FliH